MTDIDNLETTVKSKRPSGKFHLICIMLMPQYAPKKEIYKIFNIDYFDFSRFQF